MLALKTLQNVKFIKCNLSKLGHRTVAQTNDPKSLPTAGNYPLIGSTLDLLAAGSSPKLHLYVTSKHEKLGPVFREHSISGSFVFLADPNEIRRVFTIEGKYPIHFLPDAWSIYNEKYKKRRGLLFMNGEEWLHYRKILNRILLKSDITKGLVDVYEGVSNCLIQKWKPLTGSCLQSLELEMYINSLSYMIGTAMGSSFLKEKDNLKRDISHLAKIYQDIFMTTSKLMVVPVKLASFFQLPSWRNFKETMDLSLSASEAMIKKMTKNASDNGLIKKLMEEGIDEKMLVLLLSDLMVAAGDTTAFTTQWALYQLGQENFKRQEELCSNNERIKSVIKEVLRLYPAAPFLTRILSEPTNILGYDIPAGEVVVMSMYTCGRDPSNFPEAERFWPERWDKNEKGIYTGVKNPFAFLPFAVGARSCVGKKLAEAQMLLTIKSIISNFHLITEEPVDMMLRLVPTPAEEVKIKILPKQII